VQALLGVHLECGPGNERHIVEVTVDDDPGVLLKDQVEVAQRRQLEAQGAPGTFQR
jgi:hypothetical protein